MSLDMGPAQSEASSENQGHKTHPELRLQELLDSLNTRESSTLVIATVASSASVALLSLISGTKTTGVYLAGILFPIAGFAYRELTIFSIDRQDVFKIVRLIGLKRSLPSKSAFEFWAKQLRRVGFRVFLLLPLVLWMSSYQDTVLLFENSVGFTIPKVSLPIAVLWVLVVAIWLSFLEWEAKDIVISKITRNFPEIPEETSPKLQYGSKKGGTGAYVASLAGILLAMVTLGAYVAEVYGPESTLAVVAILIVLMCYMIVTIQKTLVTN